MIQAQLGLSREDLDAARVQLLKTQDERARALFPAERRQKEAAALYDETRAKTFGSLNELEKLRLLGQIEGEKQRTESSRIGAMLDIERLKQAAAIGPEEVKRVQADIEYRKKSTEEIGEARKERTDQFKKTHIEFQYPDGSKALVPAADAMKELSKGGSPTGLTPNQRFRQEDTLKQREAQAKKSEEERIAESKKQEATLLGQDSKGKPNYKNPASATAVEEFNRTASESYGYEYKEGSKPLKFSLMDSEGKPVESQHMYTAWIAYKKKYGVDISFRDFSIKFREGK